MGKLRLLWQLYIPYLLITLISLLIFGALAYWSIHSFYFSHTEEILLTRAALLGHEVEIPLTRGDTASAIERCREFAPRSHTRMTLVLISGKVIFDTDEDPLRMDNHADRPEIRQALTSGHGSSIRFSHTLGTDMLYLAVPLGSESNPAGVLRLATPLSLAESVLAGLIAKMTLAGILAAIFATIVILALARRIVRPLENLKAGASRFAAGDLQHKLPQADIPEVAALSDSLNVMAEKLENRIRTVVSQRNEVESLLSGMVEGVIYLDMDARVLRLNQAAENFLATGGSNTHGRYLHEVVRNSSLLRFTETMISEQTTREEEIVLHQPGGDRILQVFGMILQQQSGANGVLVVLHDVTGLRRLENIRKEFVANVSHELKTPITSIKGYVETLLAGAMSREEDLKRFLGTIDRQATRLQAIIDDLLSLSRIEQEQEKSSLKFELVNVRTILAASVLSHRDNAREKQISLRLECHDELSATLSPQLFEQAVGNLIHNAIKYSDHEAEVLIEALLENKQLVVRVVDHGCGIEPKHLPRLFERFYRVDTGRSRRSGGTGLGLAIVKHIVQLHKGSVEVESNPGLGSTFTIRIPV